MEELARESVGLIEEDSGIIDLKINSGTFFTLNDLNYTELGRTYYFTLSSYNLNFDTSIYSTNESQLVDSFILQIYSGASVTLTWADNIYWVDDAAPILSSLAYDLLVFYTLDNGTSWVGVLVASNVSATAAASTESSTA